MMTTIRTVEYHCNLCGNPRDMAMRGLTPDGTGLRLTTIELAVIHLCGDCWKSLRTIMAGEIGMKEEPH